MSRETDDIDDIDVDDIDDLDDIDEIGDADNTTAEDTTTDVDLRSQTNPEELSETNPEADLVDEQEIDELETEQLDEEEDIPEEDILEGEQEEVATISKEIKSAEKQQGVDIKKLSIQQTPRPNTNSKYYKVTPKGERTTRDTMTDFEFSRIISFRAAQIASGGLVFVENDSTKTPAQLAEQELRQKKCPFIIVRKISENTIEKWSANELALPFGMQVGAI
jgi:DNA-directed RNA polymerase subunit K/omega